jgi:hypothetical protein
LSTMRRNVPHCCLRHQPFFHIVGNNAEECSYFSSCVLLTTLITFLRCGPRCGKRIGIVAFTVAKWSALLVTTPKNVQIWISPWNSKPYANIHGFQSGA